MFRILSNSWRKLKHKFRKIYNCVRLWGSSNFRKIEVEKSMENCRFPQVLMGILSFFKDFQIFSNFSNKVGQTFRKNRIKFENSFKM